MAFSLSGTRLSGIWLLLGVLASPASGAVLPGDQELIRERQGRLLEEQQRRLQELKELRQTRGRQRGWVKLGSLSCSTTISRALQRSCLMGGSFSCAGQRVKVAA